MTEQITMQIPAAAFDAMVTQTPADVYCGLIDTGHTTLVNLLTFGYINTPIVDGTGVIIAYVTLWEDKRVTVCKTLTALTIVKLIGFTAYDGDFGTLDAMLIFNMFWEE